MNPNFYILTSVLLRVISQFSIKKGVSGLGQLDSFRIYRVVSLMFRVVFQKDIFWGFFIYGVAMILWLLALAKVELSYAFPFISLSFIFTPLGAAWFFGERLSIYRKIGIALICCGLLLIGLSGT